MHVQRGDAGVPEQFPAQPVRECLHGDVGHRERQYVPRQKGDSFTVEMGDRIPLLLGNREMRRAPGQQRALVKPVAQRLQGALDQVVVERQPVLSHLGVDVRGDLKVVPMQVLALGGRENGEVGRGEVQRFLGDANGGAGHCPC